MDKRAKEGNLSKKQYFGNWGHWIEKHLYIIKYFSADT
jgi:hypothetical protein